MTSYFEKMAVWREKKVHDFGHATQAEFAIVDKNYGKGGESATGKRIGIVEGHNNSFRGETMQQARYDAWCAFVPFWIMWRKVA